MVPAEDLGVSPVGSASDGWIASAYDANDLIRVFDTLWLKAGFALHAYEYRAGGNGNGIIWAVPSDAPRLAPDECPKLEDTWLPRPPGAVPIMQAIGGDGSPWSYLSASIMCREAAEFGAIWHGCVWSDQAIISQPPRDANGHDASDDPLKLTRDAPVSNWTGHGPAPRTWKPTYADSQGVPIRYTQQPVSGSVNYGTTVHIPRGQPCPRAAPDPVNGPFHLPSNTGQSLRRGAQGPECSPPKTPRSVASAEPIHRLLREPEPAYLRAR